MKSKKELLAWEKLISAQEIFQSRFPECILVGGTAVGLHAGHRVSLDADYVMRDLKKRFGDILKKVESEAGWRTKRIEPPVLILGHFQGVRTGIRQLIRSAPLETTTVRGIRIPTLGEMLRIKAYLIVRRNAARDFIDFVALYDHLGEKKAMASLQALDMLYPQEEGFSISQQLAVQLAEPNPWDLSQTDLSRYRALRPPYSDWEKIQAKAYEAAQDIMKQNLLRT